MVSQEPPRLRWCFTLNNPTEAEVACAYAGFSLPLVWFICGFEYGEVEHTPHLQGAFVLNDKQRITTLHLYEGLERASFFGMKGTPEDSRVYCSKGKDCFELGEMPAGRAAAGKREKLRWKENIEMAKAGNVEDCDPQIYLTFYRTLKQIKTDHMQAQEDLDGVCGVWIYGRSGVGKSRKARADYPDFYYKLANKWFDGYQGEPAIIIEDLDKQHSVLGHQLKLWADRYAFNAETKGGMINIRPKNVVVTSQYSIEEIFEDVETQSALKRRYKVIHMLDPLVPESVQSGSSSGRKEEKSWEDFGI